jgi:hypothetical protein
MMNIGNKQRSVLQFSFTSFMLNYSKGFCVSKHSQVDSPGGGKALWGRAYLKVTARVGNSGIESCVAHESGVDAHQVVLGYLL